MEPLHSHVTPRCLICHAKHLSGTLHALSYTTHTGLSRADTNLLHPYPLGPSHKQLPSISLMAYPSPTQPPTHDCAGRAQPPLPAPREGHPGLSPTLLLDLLSGPEPKLPAWALPAVTSCLSPPLSMSPPFSSFNKSLSQESCSQGLHVCHPSLTAVRKLW